MKNLLFLILFFIPFGIAYGADSASFYDNHGFLIEYPAKWGVVDTWSDTQKIFFKSDYVGKSGITITYPETYELADSYKREFIKIENVSEKIKTVEDSLRNACKINKYGPCWNFELLDSKIIVIDNEQAISIKYVAVMEDQKTTVKIIMLPDGEHFWYVVAKAVGEETDFEPYEKYLASFHIKSNYNKLKAITEYMAPIQNIQTPFDRDIVLEKTMDVNLILVGNEWTSTLKSSVLNNLPSYRDPLIVSSQEKTGVRHTYNYNFVSVSKEEIKELSNFMTTHSRSMPIFGSNLGTVPIWQAYWVAANHPEWVELDNQGNVKKYNIDYRLIDALPMEEHIYQKFIESKPELSNPNSVNLVFIAMDLDDANFLRNYSVSNRDDASGKTFSSIGLMGYGGNYNMFFFDLYSAPWLDFDLQSGKYVFPEWIKTLHDCNSNECLSDLITFHTSQALQFIVSPDLLYPVKNEDKYVIDAVIYTKPGGQNSVTPQTLVSFVDQEKIKKEFKYLYPQSEWEINFSLERRDTRGISYDFKQQLEYTVPFTLKTIYGKEKAIELLQTSKIQPYLISWAEQHTSNANTNVRNIPVLIEIDSSDQFDVYLDSLGVLGISPSKSNSDESCCAFGVTSQKKLWGEQIGFTDLLIHEVGHSMGLMHPFMSINESGDYVQNQYFNWYSSPMTYSLPNSGCGLLFNLIYSDPCGNPSLSFTEFERNIINDVRIASYWKETDSNLKNTHNENSAQSSQILQASKNAYKNGDIYSSVGSIKLAKEALLTSQTPNKISNPAPIQLPKVPDWVKNNAKWWSEGQIDDDSFVQGIQHLVKEKIISIPNTSNSASSDGKVPDWVKNNAKWWSEGLISDGDFLKGIEYLAKSGIIKVN